MYIAPYFMEYSWSSVSVFSLCDLCLNLCFSIGWNSDSIHAKWKITLLSVCS